MYKDIDRVRDSIIPALLIQIAMRHLADRPQDDQAYRNMLAISEANVFATVQDLHVDKRMRIYKRLDRLVYKVMAYLIKAK